jgi:hypothetical protein
MAVGATLQGSTEHPAARRPQRRKFGQTPGFAASIQRFLVQVSTFPVIVPEG